MANEAGDRGQSHARIRTRSQRRELAEDLRVVDEAEDVEGRDELVASFLVAGVAPPPGVSGLFCFESPFVETTVRPGIA